ncbi:MAG: 2-carboxy-1,4-naphthoquinone phytyltransferase [Elainellaceae cyanobacterium]
MTTKQVSSPAQSVPGTSKLWLAAIKPPMYSVAIIPIWVGSAVAWAQRGQIDWRTFGAFLLSAIAIVAWLNLSNDVFDAETGIDRNKAHSVVNLTRNRVLVFWIANGFLGVGLLGIAAIAWWQQDVTILGIVALCCALGYSYQGPPFRLGYQGLGEPICFVTFGPLAVSAAYYSQNQTWSWSSLTASAIVGISTSLILFCSHFHQIEDDAAAGKRSPIVRLGTGRGAKLVVGMSVSIYLVAIAGVGLGQLPLQVLIMLGSAPLAYRLSRFVQRHHSSPAQISSAKFVAVALHFWSGLLLGLGLLAA